MQNTEPFKIQKVQKRSAEVQAADALRDGIVSGEIPPGTRLTEIKLAAQLGVSRATIRAAFHQLAQEGLIDQVPYTGWTVITLSSIDAWELYTLRSSLEALGSRLVAARIKRGEGGAVIPLLDRAFEDLKDACRGIGSRQVAEADFALHRTIIDLARHKRLSDQYSKVQQQVRIYISSSDALVGTMQSIVEQHVPIVDAIKSGDVESAARTAIAHNEDEGEKLVSYLKQVEANANRSEGSN